MTVWPSVQSFSTDVWTHHFHGKYSSGVSVLCSCLRLSALVMELLRAPIDWVHSYGAPSADFRLIYTAGDYPSEHSCIRAPCLYLQITTPTVCLLWLSVHSFYVLLMCSGERWPNFELFLIFWFLLYSSYWRTCCARFLIGSSIFTGLCVNYTNQVCSVVVFLTQNAHSLVSMRLIL